MHRKYYLRLRSAVLRRAWLLLLLPILPATVSAQVGQSKWKWVSPTPIGFSPNDVSYVNNNLGIAVGSAGGIGRTTDAGQTWSYGTFMYTNVSGAITKPSFNDVHFATPQVAYAVGDGGVMIRSTDGGINWTTVVNPLHNMAKNINTVWFINKDTGYIAGQAIKSSGLVAADSTTPDLITPKIYITRNGGATWDSLQAPIGAPTNVGYVSNPANSPRRWNLTAFGKEIFKIVFANDSVGYVVGSAGSGGYPIVYAGSASGNSFNGASAPLIWKIKNNQLTDYSISKEKVGLSGASATLTTSSTYSSPTLNSQILRAVAVLNDSLIVVGTFNNGFGVRIKTGINDSTQLLNLVGNTTFAKGVYEVVQAGSWPTAQTGTPVPPFTGVQVFPSANIFSMAAGPNGSVYVASSNGRLIKSLDAGRTWSISSVLPASTNVPTAYINAVTTTADGSVHVMGFYAAYADSIAGQAWRSSYKAIIPTSGANRVAFGDCGRGIVAGLSGMIYTTTDGGTNWTNRSVATWALAGPPINVVGVHFTSPTRAVIANSIGEVYESNDLAASLDLLFNTPVATTTYTSASVGSRIWMVGHRSAAPTYRSVIFRSLNNGATWDTTTTPFVTGTNAAVLQTIKFANADTGYVAGSRGKIYRTVDGGGTWTDVSPFPAVNASATFLGIGLASGRVVYAITTLTKKMYKTIDAGATWTDISAPINAITNEPFTNIQEFVMHDENNFYVLSGGSGGKMLRTNDGGNTYVMENAPENALFQPLCATFVPAQVPAGTPMDRRKLWIAGSTVSGLAFSHVFQFGDDALVNLSSSETATAASCATPNGGTISVSASGGILPYTYSVDGGAAQASNSFTGLSAGPHTIKIMDAGCGVRTRTVQVGFTNNLTLTTTADTSVCTGATFNLNASSQPGTSFSWTPAAGLVNPTTATPSVTAAANATYTVTATLGTCTLSHPVQVTVRALPNVSAGPDKTIGLGASVQLEGAAATAASITWSPAAALSNPAILTPMAQPTVTTTYTLTVRDAANCQASDDVIVNVLPDCVKVMDAFTPNGDGMNDVWIVTNNACLLRSEVAVYNRYGGAVYRNADYKNNWDGTYNGKPVADGTYYFRITIHTADGRLLPLTGNVTILR